jgi:hypothetical protein
MVELSAGTETRRKVEVYKREPLHKSNVKRWRGVRDSTPGIVVSEKWGDYLESLSNMSR